jgi:hypothetical protein
MTDEQINAAITEVIDADPHWKCAKDYCNDLNAMHEAEKVLKGYEQIATYVWHLENRSGDWSTDEHLMATHATARQRAEAFLRTLGKWDQSGDTTEMVKEVQK